MHHPFQAPVQITVVECDSCGGFWLADHDRRCPRCLGRPDGESVPYIRLGQLPRWWWWPPHELTEPWKVTVFRGGDEWGRNTLALQLGPLGCVTIADPRRWRP